MHMFKYLLLKTIYDISEVDVVERSLFNMSFKYFLEMILEEDVINSNLINLLLDSKSRIRKRHSSTLSFQYQYF